MKTMSCSGSRARYAETLNAVVDDRRLLTSIDRLESGGGQAHEPIG